MPKRRDLIRMSDDETRTFIESQKTIQLATIGQDGQPHLVPLWFGLVDGEIVLETFTKSQKVKNVERDPRVTVLLEDGEVYDQLKGVMIQGRVEIHHDDETVHRLHREVIRRNMPELPEEVVDETSRRMAPKKTALVVKPEKTVTWDHGKLGGVY